MQTFQSIEKLKLKTYLVYKLGYLSDKRGFKECPNSNYEFIIGDYPVGKLRGWGEVKHFLESGLLNGRFVEDGYYRLQATGRRDYTLTKSIYIKWFRGRRIHMLQVEIRQLRRGYISDAELLDPPKQRIGKSR